MFGLIARWVGLVEQALGSGDGKAAIKSVEFLVNHWQRCSSSTDMQDRSGEFARLLSLLGRPRASDEMTVCVHLGPLSYDNVPQSSLAVYS